MNYVTDYVHQDTFTIIYFVAHIQQLKVVYLYDTNLFLSGFTDETPRDYHCNLGPDGRRRDAEERPELCRGTVEFVASKEYMVG